MIRAQNLTKSFPDHGLVVDQVSLEIPAGECLVLVGRSGCGKSTLLKILNGLIQPDDGEAWIGGEKIVGNPLQRRRVGYVIQQGGLFPHLTVAQNISLPAKISKIPSSQIESRVDGLLKLVNLDPTVYASKYSRELSGGEQQRIGIARALILDPPVLLLDEPFGALDPITRRQLQNDFLKLQKNLGQKKTILFVTHDMQEALLMGNRIAVIDQGKILQIGTPEEIRKNPATDFVADFFRVIP